MKVLFPPKWVGKLLQKLTQEKLPFPPEGVQLLLKTTERCRSPFQHVGLSRGAKNFISCGNET